MKLKLIGALLVLSILFALYPIYFSYQDKTIPELPKHHTYQQVVTKLLPDSIKALAAEKKCSGFVLPVTAVEGVDASFKHLKDDINLALSAYPGWQLMAEKQVQEQMKKRLEANIKKWGTMYSGSEIERISKAKKTVVSKTQTSVAAKWLYLKDKSGDDVKLLVTVYDELSTARLFEIALTFMHPKTLTKLKAGIARRKAKIAEMQRYADVSTHILYGLLVLFFLTALVMLVQAIIQKGKDRHTRKLLLIEIGKREELVENGHFVTADELARKYLKYFPDDTDIRAFHQRLLDFTNNDPKTAQTAFVEARKLKARLSEHANEPQKLLLSGSEKDNLQALLPYHPELNTAYNKLLQIEEQTQVRQNLDTQLKELQTALRGGYVVKAGHILDQITAQHPEAPDVEAWRKELDIKKQEAETSLNSIRAMFRQGNLEQGYSDLKEFLIKYPDDTDGQELNTDLDKLQGVDKLRLNWSNQNIVLDLFAKEELIIGRLDEGANPDIAFDDRRISRNHATIKRNAGGIEICDNGSTGGTYVDGKKISTAILKDRTILNLAKIKEFTVLETIDEQNHTSGLLMTSKGLHFGFLLNKLSFNLNNGSFDNNKATYSIYKSNQKITLSWNDGFAVLSPGKTIQAGADHINVEAI